MPDPESIPPAPVANDQPAGSAAPAAAQAPSSGLRERLARDWSLWLAGIGPEVAERCTDAEHRKLGAIGYTVLVPPLLALFAAGYATSLFTTNPIPIGAIALAWAFIVLTIDRGIVATFRESLSPGQKARQFVIRLALAGLLGLTISHPLTLLVFGTTVQEEVERRFDEDGKEKVAEVEAQIGKVQGEVTKIQAGLDVPPSHKFDGETAEAPEVAAARTRLDGLRAEARQITEDRAQTHAELQRAEEEFANEVNGHRDSGRAGEGPIARNINDTRVVPLQGTLKALEGQESRLQEEIRDADRELARVQAANAARIDEERKDFLVTQARQRQASESELEKLRAEIDRLRERQRGIESGTEAKIAAMRPDAPDRKRPDLLQQTLALHDLFKDRERGGDIAFLTFLCLAGVFLAVDILPVLVKFSTKRGEYDERIDFHHEVAKRVSAQELAERFPVAVQPASADENGSGDGAGGRSSSGEDADPPLHSRMSPPTGERPVPKPSATWPAPPTGPGSFLALGALGLFLLFQPGLRIPVADAAVDRHLNQATTKAMLSYGTCRLFNAGISVAKETEVTLGIFGNGVQVAAGQVLDPLDDLVERASDIFLTATASLVIQRVIHDLTIRVSPALCGIVLLGVMATGLVRGRTFPVLRRYLFLALFAILLVRGVVPVSVLLGQTMDKLYFERKADELKEAVPLAEFELGDLKDVGRVKDLAGEIWESGDTLTKYFVESSSMAIAKFVLEVIVFPLGFFLLLTKAANLIFGWNLPPVLRQRDIDPTRKDRRNPDARDAALPDAPSPAADPRSSAHPAQP